MKLAAAVYKKRFIWLFVALLAGMLIPAPPVMAVMTAKTYPIPTPNSQPLSIVTGPDGNLWFTEMTTSKIGKINPYTGDITEYDTQTPGHFLAAITVGPDDNVWVAGGTETTGIISKINPYTGDITDYIVPTPTGDIVSLTTGPDGNMWFAAWKNDKIGKITLGGTVTLYDTLPNSWPSSIAAGPDGNMWFTEQLAGKIGRITPSGDITKYDIPTAGSGAFAITAGPDGNMWFTQASTGKIGKITPSGAISEYSLPVNDHPIYIVVGPDNNLWFTDSTKGKISKLDIETGQVAGYSVHAAGALLAGITVGPDNNLWFTDYDNNLIGVLYDLFIDPTESVSEPEDASSASSLPVVGALTPPRTGYGQPSTGSLPVVVIAALSILSLGSGLVALYRYKV